MNIGFSFEIQIYEIKRTIKLVVKVSNKFIKKSLWKNVGKNHDYVIIFSLKIFSINFFSQKSVRTSNIFERTSLKHKKCIFFIKYNMFKNLEILVFIENSTFSDKSVKDLELDHWEYVLKFMSLDEQCPEVHKKV